MASAIDLSGQRFGKLTVISRNGSDSEGKAMWLCKCDCGEYKTIRGKSLRGGTRSCGCLCAEAIRNACLKDHTGERFGRLVVLSRADDYIAPNGKHHVCWLCACDCGAKTIVDVTQLVGGHTKSCGCLASENLHNGNNRKHSGCKDRLYKVYHNIKNRCYNENASDYKYYGLRGISMCDEWFSDYQAFKDWAYANGYDDTAPKGKCTIDRIDVNGNYEPNNCRWVSMSIQSQNRRNVINKQNDKRPRKDTL